MAIGARLSAWWGAWKVVVILAAALAGSLFVNYWQHRRAITAPLREQISGLEGALEDSAALAAAGRETALRLNTAADAATRRLAAADRDYRNAVRVRPLTDSQCAPGQGRVDAVNRALGASTEGEE